MPFGDGRGPAEMGPMTGRGAGFCAGSWVPGYRYPLTPGGFQGAGFGRGHRRWFRATGLTGWQRGWYGDRCVQPDSAPYGSMPSARQDQLDHLKLHAASLEEMLSDIRKRIEALETVPEAE